MSVIVDVQMVLALLLGLCLSALVIVFIFSKMTHRNCSSEKTMAGKTVIVTGGDSGIGKETALQLATRGARVILASENTLGGQDAVEEIARRTGGDVTYQLLDLSCLDSVRAFAKRILATESRLDVLINNAGICMPTKMYTTPDGMERTFQVNYLGHFLLTNLLLDLLKRSAPSRVIAVSSTLHHLGSNERILRGGYLGTDSGHILGACVYGDSKLACVHFVKEFTERYRHTGVTANVLHPGMVRTPIFTKGTNIIDKLFSCGLHVWAKSPTEGAQTALHLAMSDDVADVSGEYFTNCRPAWSSPSALDTKVRSGLWEISCRLSGLPLDTPNPGSKEEAKVR